MPLNEALLVDAFAREGGVGEVVGEYKRRLSKPGHGHRDGGPKGT